MSRRRIQEAQRFDARAIPGHEPIADVAAIARIGNEIIHSPCHGRSEMIADDAVSIAARLMSEFATRSGLSSPAQKQQRYLWTDAFAVCNFLELFERTGDAGYRSYATALIDQVHRVLGRFRADDVRSGWISGLDDETGRRHPTAGGLRIGKPLKERKPGEAIDERLEWDRDGQYFHYLTKWMHALCLAGIITGNPEYIRWAAELAATAFQRFARRSRSGEVLGIYWKMSTDLSRPLVPATGLHDALDGCVSFREVQHASAQVAVSAELPDLSAAIHVAVGTVSAQRLDDGRPARTRWAPLRCLPALSIVATAG